LIWSRSPEGDVNISRLNLVEYAGHLSIIVRHSQAGQA